MSRPDALAPEFDAIAAPILRGGRMATEVGLIQHGRTSCFAHSVAVAYCALSAATRFGIPLDRRALVRGALLHDYFLYDWHIPDKSHRLHGFTHPRRALAEASHDFTLGKTERDIIARHMFPLVPSPPRSREGMLVCLTDKYLSLLETLSDVPYTAYYRRRIDAAMRELPGNGAARLKGGADDV